MSEAARTAPAADPDRTVVYVMTHHPRVALTFIADEVRTLEAAGWNVVPVAMKSPDVGDLDTAWARDQSARTTYLDTLHPLVLVMGVVSIVLRHPISAWGVIGRVVRSAGLDVGIVAKRLAHLAYADVVRDVCRAHGVRHVHAHFGLSPASIAWCSSLLADLDGGPPVTWSFTIHGFHDFTDHRLARLDLKARSAAFVACISNSTRAQLCLLVDPAWWDRLHVVRCGIDFGRFTPRVHEVEHHTRSRLRIIVVARLSDEKGHSVLISAAAELARRGVDVALEFVGAGPAEHRLRDQALRSGVDVDFAGELQPTKVRERLARSDVFCLPSLAEGIPVSIMEAMAVGTVVVATNVGGVSELVRHGETGWLVAPGDATGLADVIAVLAADRSIGAAVAGSARRAVESMHDLDANVGGLAALFTGALGPSDQA